MALRHAAQRLAQRAVDLRAATRVDRAQVLRAARDLPEYLRTDPIDKAHALILLDAPDKACGFSRDGFIDLDEVKKETRALR